jgi:hypothetical protein
LVPATFPSRHRRPLHPVRPTGRLGQPVPPQGLVEDEVSGVRKNPEEKFETESR